MKNIQINAKNAFKKVFFFVFIQGNQGPAGPDGERGPKGDKVRGDTRFLAFH